MREIGAIVLVYSQTEPTLEAAQMVAEDVWILVEIDRLERELAQALAPVGICRGLGGDTAAAKLGAGAILEKIRC